MLWLCLVLVVTVCSGQDTNLPGCAIDPAHRFDCHPEPGATKEKCEDRGCCWLDNDWNLSKRTQGKPPVCFYSSDFPAYVVSDVTDAPFGFTMDLEKNETMFFPGEVTHVKVHVIYESDNRIHVRMFDPAVERYIVPLDVPTVIEKAANPIYNVTVSSVGQWFKMTVNRNTENASKPIFTTEMAAPLIFTDQFLQLSTILPSGSIYGLGEQRQDLMIDMNWRHVTLYTEDHWPLEDVNLYGAHPFYMNIEEDGTTNGFFFMNSNAMDVELQPTPALTWKTIGGILDFYIFAGPTPDDVMDQLTAVVGKPAFPPYWSMGFQICRFGYKNLEEEWGVVNGVRRHRIPQDVQFSDSDYMVGNLDFTRDTERFGNISEFAIQLHDRGMKYIVIVDPGISSTQPAGSYRPYDLGTEMDIFIKNASGGELNGIVWPGNTVFPDFSDPATFDYWYTLIKEFLDEVDVDGLWVDMNEISSFAHGSIDGCTGNRWDDPPYLPDVVGGTLYYLTTCPSAPQKFSLSYDVHSLYGLMETNMTYQVLKTLRPDKRPFVLSRSTYTGIGKWGAHWGGDNVALWHDIFRSVSAIVTLGLFGMPMVGDDICGFQNDTNYELCLRWYQMGAFYPYARSHNSNAVRINQDPSAFDDYFAGVVRSVMEVRYSLLPYLYTLFYESTMNGAPPMRGMFYEFPGDAGSLAEQSQFMWGSGLLIVPVLHEGAMTVEAYLPADTLWYNFTTGISYVGEGKNITLNATLDEINLLVQSGSILPMQEHALTTEYSRQNDFNLLVAIDGDVSAQGWLFWDDGESPDHEYGVFNLITFKYKAGRLWSKVQNAGYDFAMMMSHVTFYGVDNAPSSVMIEGFPQDFEYDAENMVVRVPKLVPKIDLRREFEILIE